MFKPHQNGNYNPVTKEKALDWKKFIVIKTIKYKRAM
jgi:hypothetical protein